MSAAGAAERWRGAIAAGVLLTAFAALGAQAARLSWSGERDVARPLAPAPEASRVGDLVDRRGEILASTLKTYSLFADPTLIWSAEETADALAGVLPDLDRAEALAALKSSKRFVWLKRNLTPRQRQAVFDLGLPGLAFRDEPKRVYPRGRLAAHVLGFVDRDGRGVAGAERAFEAELTAGDGRPVALSIDLRVQFALDETLRDAVERYQAKAAVGLVTDVRTGEILAMVSLPDFDPNAPNVFNETDAPSGSNTLDAPGLARQRGADFADAQFNRALAGVFEPGSTFKTFTFAAAFEEGLADPVRALAPAGPLRLDDAVIEDDAPLASPASLRDAFVRSSNVAAAKLALALGEDAHRDTLSRLGLLERAPIAYLESARPLLPPKWDETARATIGFGHGVAVSPVAFMAAFGATVNGGVYVRPTMRPADPRGVDAERVFAPETSAAMLAYLRAVVEQGTGLRAEVEGLRVAGKTGTAEKVGPDGYDPDRVVASFAAVFPYDDPAYGVLISLDEPLGEAGTTRRHSAGYTAAPAAAAVITRIAPLLGVARRLDEPLVAVQRIDAP